MQILAFFSIQIDLNQAAIPPKPRAKAVENKMSANKEKIKKIIIIGLAATVALTVLCVAAVMLLILGGVGFFHLSDFIYQ